MKGVRILPLLAVLLLSGAFALSGQAGQRPADQQGEGPLQAKEVSYQGGGQTLQGYLVHDPAIKGPRPGILVVHEWWGHNDYARRRAQMLARLGYTALAVDMYGEGRQAEHPDDAGAFAQAVYANWPQGQARFQAALELLRDQPTVQADQIAAIGYCFGGGVVLNMARSGADLAGVASFHGSLNPIQPASPGKVKARILVLHGAEDAFVSDDQVGAFLQEMERAGADVRFISYLDAQHGFTNPAADRLAQEFDLAIGYNALADERSWEAMQGFLQQLFAAQRER